MRVAVISANLGSFDNPQDIVPQSVKCDFFRFTDENFPPREKALTPRLQARIPKMFGWQMKPGYDIYVWLDSSVTFEHPDSVKWLLEQLGDADVAVLKHPNRSSLKAEADYLKERLKSDNQYIIPRYKNELIDEQLAEIDADTTYVDNRLYASTVYVYRNTQQVRDALKEWWYHTSRYHSIDQLSFPYILRNLRVNVMNISYFKTPYITYTRASKRKHK